MFKGLFFQVAYLLKVTFLHFNILKHNLQHNFFGPIEKRRYSFPIRMLIGLEGTFGSGGEDVVRIFTQKLKFKLLYLESIVSCDDESIQVHDLTIFKRFQDPECLLNYVTANWRENLLICNLRALSNLEMFLKRPFFMLITIDSSINLKFKRVSNKYPSWTLEKVCEESDKLQLNPKYCSIQDKAKLKLINNTLDTQILYDNLQKLDLTNPERLRPHWDSYFMHFADLAAMRSNCMKRRVGCVIVKDNRVVATGYNGTPRGAKNCNEGGCNRCNHPAESGSSSGVALSTCLCLHAEENALLEAGRRRVEENSILYCNTCPCLTCTIKIVQVGITEVVYSQSYSMDEFSEKVFREAGIKFRQFIPPTYGTIVIQ